MSSVWQESFDLGPECQLVEKLEGEALALAHRGNSVAAMKKFEEVSRTCLPCMKATPGMVCRKVSASKVAGFSEQGFVAKKAGSGTHLGDPAW